MNKISDLDKTSPDSRKLDPEKVKNIIGSIEDLPAIPTAFMNIREIIKNPKSSVRDLSEEVEKDQALTSKILKIANSAYYGFPRTISTINYAVILMGFQKVWYIAMSVSLMNLFPKDSKIFNREEFWEHSVKVGICAQIIAKVFRYPNPPELYTIGLLHDIGKLILDQYFHDNFIEVIKRAKEKSISFLEAENEVMGVNHTMIGAWLTDRWKFPKFFVEGIFHHHGEFTHSDSRVAQIIGFADTLCLMKGFGPCYDKNIKETYKELKNQLNLTEKQIENIENQFKETEAIISIREEKK